MNDDDTSEFLLPENLEYLNRGLSGEHAALAEKYREVMPKFIIIGAAKAGTTSLGATLNRHPEIRMSFPKEPKFFGRCYYKGWDWYAKVMSKGGPVPAIGEASTMYASAQELFEHSPKLMKLYIPEVKLIYLTRHPMHRITSHWRHWKGRKPGFVEFNKIYDKAHPTRLIIGCSKYFERISGFRKEFDDSQILPLALEDFENNPAPMMEQVLRFIGVDPSVDLLENGQLRRVNSADEGRRGRIPVAAPVWEKPFKDRVIADLQPDTTRFLEWMGKPADYWDLEKV